MTQQNALRRRISGRFSQKVDNQSIVTGTIGDGAGNIETGTPNKIFCQVGDQVIQAWANDVPKVYGLSVYIVNSTRYPGELEIIAGNARYNTIFSGYNNNVAEHGIEHSWLGRDPVWVQLRQFMPLWIGAAGNPAAPYTIRIGRGLVWTAGGLAEVQNQVVNLEDFLPISGAGGERYCRYALITIGSAGEIVSTAGTSVAEADFGLDDIPAAPAGTLMVLGAVRLYSDQESIVEARDRTDIIDLRYPYRHTHTAAEAGGHDAVTVADTATVDLSLTGQQISADVIPSGIDAADLGSGAATYGQVLTADGAGGAAWEAPTGGGSALTVKEADGTPSAANVNTIQVTNGTMTDEGNGVVTLDFGSAATDGSAIHDNVAGEIHAIAEKTNLVDNDELIIEDSADSYNKKRVKKSNVSGGGTYWPAPIKPTLSSFTWVNQETATATENGDGIWLLAPALLGDKLRILKKSAPSAPYKITAMFLPFLHSQNYNNVGLCWRQSSNGKLVTFDVVHVNGPKIEASKCNSPTAIVAAYFQFTFPIYSPFWLQLEDDGINRKSKWSIDGYNFIQIHSIGRTDFITADEVGFYASSVNNAYPAAIKLLSWKEE